MPPEANPRLVFERLFGKDTGGGGNKAERLRLARQNKSILDFVMEDAKRLQSRLGRVPVVFSAGFSEPRAIASVPPETLITTASAIVAVIIVSMLPYLRASACCSSRLFPNRYVLPASIVKGLRMPARASVP